MGCRVVQCFAVCCSACNVWLLMFSPSRSNGVLQCVAEWCGALQCVAVRVPYGCSCFLTSRSDGVLQSDAVCCSVVQCVAVCCSAGGICLLMSSPIPTQCDCFHKINHSSPKCSS